MKIEEIISTVRNESFQLQRKFVELITSNLAIGIRSICSYNELSDKEKIKSIWHLNELHHRIINQTRAKYPAELNRIAEYVISINKQNSTAGKELGAIIQLAFDSFKQKSPEQNFVEKISCNFPYNDNIESSKLISESLHFSPNATYAIIEELARIPIIEREQVTKTRLMELVNEIDKQFDHHLKFKILEVTKSLIREEQIGIVEAETLMDEISMVVGLWSALAIVYESCEDQDDRLDNKFNKIRSKWNSK